MAKEGSTIGGLMDTIGTPGQPFAKVSGVPLETLVKKFAHQRFEPSGFTKNPDIPIAKSISDYLFRWLGCQFIPGYREANSPNASASGRAAVEGSRRAGTQETRQQTCRRLIPANRRRSRQRGRSSCPWQSCPPCQQLNRSVQHFMQDAPACDTCGAITVRNGACYKCLNCGNSMGMLLREVSGSKG